MRLNYHIEFTELIEDTDDITDEELAKIKRQLKKHMQKFLFYSGAKFEDIKLELDFQEE